MDKLAVETGRGQPTLWTNLVSSAAAMLGKRLIGRPKVGSVSVTFPNGKTRTFGRPGTGEHANLVLKSFAVVSNTMKRGTVGFAQSYIDGDVEVDDLTALFKYFLQNRDVFDAAVAQVAREGFRVQLSALARRDHPTGP